MKLDEIAQRYADTIFAKRLNELQKKHQAALQGIIEEFAARGLSRSGIEASAKVKQHLNHLHALVDARIQSYFEAYEKSGTLLEEGDIREILAEVTDTIVSGVVHRSNDAAVNSLTGHVQRKQYGIIAEARRQLQLHLDGLTLEDRKTRSYASRALHDLFENDFQRVRRRLDEIDRELSRQIIEASEELQKATGERLSHCALTCRRVLKAFADAVCPPTDQQPTGRCFDDAHYVNRLCQFAAERLQSKDSRELVQLSLENLGKRVESLNDLASKGVHSTVAQREAERCLIQAIFLLSELAEL